MLTEILNKSEEEITCFLQMSRWVYLNPTANEENFICVRTFLPQNLGPAYKDQTKSEV